MERELPKFEFLEVLRGDVEEIFAARKNAQIIHHAKDIDAAGDEVEEAVRKVLRRKLPLMYYVGHGHIVDSYLKCSPQLDIIIADNTGAPILFQAKNGSEYLPYETVYAIGEVKSGYYKEKSSIREFSRQLARIQSGLQRKRNIIEPMNRGEAAYKNALFSFMIFVQSNDFEIEHVVELYQSTPPGELPTVVYFLDKGMIMNTNIYWLRGPLGNLEPLYVFCKIKVNHWGKEIYPKSLPEGVQICYCGGERESLHDRRSGDDHLGTIRTDSAHVPRGRTVGTSHCQNTGHLAADRA